MCYNLGVKWGKMKKIKEGLSGFYGENEKDRDNVILVSCRVQCFRFIVSNPSQPIGLTLPINGSWLFKIQPIYVVVVVIF